MTTQRRRWVRSLRFRLLAATLAALLVALLLAGLFMSKLFRDHVQRQFSAGLVSQIDQLTARLEFDADGRPRIDGATLADPRWSRPYSGLYWQLDALSQGSLQRGVLRSRSLWDATLQAAADLLDDGVVHVHEARGPDGAPVLLVERTVRAEGDAPMRWRLVVAADLRETQAAIDRFNGVLAASLGVLLVLLCVAAVAQVALGLAPLRALQRALAAVHAGTARQLHGEFPAELQPLVNDFNAVLARNAEVVDRARTQAGNLAHAIKTPLAAMAQAASAAERHPHRLSELGPLVQEQVATARRHVDWHLARSRAAAATGLPGARAAIVPVIDGLLRVMRSVHASRELKVECDAIDPAIDFAGEAQDLQEMLGNVLDNACQWARSAVHLSVAYTDAARSRLRIVVDDDGPGIEPARRDAVMARGARLDESLPGSGLGLAIVHELADLYGGCVTLETADPGGLRVCLVLPAASSGSIR